MADLVRKGDYAEHALAGRDPELAAAMDDLAALFEMGCLAGVAEIVRERRRQVVELGYTAEHDDRCVLGELPMYAVARVLDLTRQWMDGTGSYAESEEACRQAGALLAAEIDRQIRLVTAQVENGERHPELGIITPDMR